jgi:hypothetical protein
MYINIRFVADVEDGKKVVAGTSTEIPVIVRNSIIIQIRYALTAVSDEPVSV